MADGTFYLLIKFGESSAKTEKDILVGGISGRGIQYCTFVTDVTNNVSKFGDSSAKSGKDIEISDFTSWVEKVGVAYKTLM